jgi:hypothetical protein
MTPRAGTALAAVFLLGATPAWSGDLPASVKTLVEACGVMDDDLSRVLDSDVALVDSGAVSRNADGTYRVTTETYTVGAGSLTLCSDSRFYGQRMVSGLPFRSAVQVGPDLVLTAWHSSTNGATPALYAISGLRYRLAEGRCVPPDFARVPAADVFSVTEVVADGLAAGVAPPRDFLLLRLDRAAAAASPRVRRSGQGRADAAHHDRLTVVSHPDRLATKIDLAGTLAGYPDQGYTGPLAENLHPLEWSSGGMVYNRDERFVETVVRSGLSATYAQAPGSCWKVMHLNARSATNDSVADFAEHIPPFELLVTPLDAVVHEGRAGGELSSPTTRRTIEAPLTAPDRIDYRITPPEVGAAGPDLLVTFGGPLQGSLAPGSALDVEETFDARGVACGQYERTYSVTDVTHGFTDVIRHVFQIQCP